MCEVDYTSMWWYPRTMCVEVFFRVILATLLNEDFVPMNAL